MHSVCILCSIHPQSGAVRRGCIQHQHKLFALGRDCEGMDGVEVQDWPWYQFLVPCQPIQKQEWSKDFFRHSAASNWLLFIKFALWFIFPLTAHQWTELYLKVHHLVSNLKWMILILKGIRKKKRKKYWINYWEMENFSCVNSICMFL